MADGVNQTNVSPTWTESIEKLRENVYTKAVITVSLDHLTELRAELEMATIHTGYSGVARHNYQTGKVAVVATTDGSYSIEYTRPEPEPTFEEKIADLMAQYGVIKITQQMTEHLAELSPVDDYLARSLNVSILSGAVERMKNLKKVLENVRG